MEFIGGVSGGTLGFIHNGVRGAIAGYKYGRKAGKTYHKTMAPIKRPSTGKAESALRKKRKVTKIPGPYRSNGYSRRPLAKSRIRKRKRKNAKKSSYKGKLQRVKRNKMSMEALCLSKGAHRTLEQYGTFSDPDCVYFLHSSSNVDEIASAMNASLLRSILNKAGFKITNNFNELSVSNPTGGLNQSEDASGLKFVLTCRNANTGDYTNYFYDSLDGQGFKDICDTWTDMRFRFIDYIRGDNKDEIYKLAIYKLDFVGLPLAPQWRLGAEMYLEDISVELYIQSNLMIQNRTKGANVSTDDGNFAERIDAQPLKGWLYEFKHADPRVKHSGNLNGTKSNIKFNTTTDAGIKIIRGAEYDGGSEPFVPKYFSNISKATKIVLQPGEIRRTGFSYEQKGKLVNVLKKLRIARRIGIPDYTISGMVGKAQMIALEEILRTPSDNKVTIAYEREMKTGCVFKEHRSPAPLETFVLGQEINSNV